MVVTLDRDKLEYTAAFVIAILANQEVIDSFLESTTAILTPSQLAVVPKETAEFMQQEGHTLWNTGSHTTNVPSRGGLRENLIIWRADIDLARYHVLTEEEDSALLQRANRRAGRPSAKLTETSEIALFKVIAYLNG